MPVPGVPNNPEGTNSFDHFAPEPAYGEGTKQKALAGGAPLAGGQVAAGSLNAARRSQRQAVSPPKQQPAKAAAMEPVPVPMTDQPGPVSSAETWAAIAAEGAGRYPILDELAAAARG